MESRTSLLPNALYKWLVLGHVSVPWLHLSIGSEFRISSGDMQIHEIEKILKNNVYKVLRRQKTHKKVLHVNVYMHELF